MKGVIPVLLSVSFLVHAEQDIDTYIDTKLVHSANTAEIDINRFIDQQADTNDITVFCEMFKHTEWLQKVCFQNTIDLNNKAIIIKLNYQSIP